MRTRFIFLFMCDTAIGSVSFSKLRLLDFKLISSGVFTFYGNMERGDEEDVDFGRRAKGELPRKSADKNEVKYAKSILSGNFDDEVYSKEYKRAGRCLIFNHTTFTHDVDDRPYSGLDAQALDDFFGSRGFDVTIYSDRKVSQIYIILENEAQNKKEYHKDAGCFVCCVLTHGKLRENQEYLCAKDNIYPTECLFAPFAGNRCEPLAGKPKIFFIQACRGDDYDPGVNIFYKLLGKDLFPTVLAQTEGNSSRHISEPLLCCKIPVKADFLIAYSTAPKSIAWKRNKEGSWFIQALCQVFEHRADDSDLLSMLTVVCRKVAYEYESYLTESTDTDSMKQVPSMYSTLTKLVKFPEKKN